MAAKKSKQPKRDIYQTVTDRILELLDQGVAPWRHPIRRRGGDNGFPKSLSTGKTYRGINVFLLAMTSWMERYESSYWATFNQIKKQGGSVRKGERSTLVVFWKQYATNDRETGQETTVPVLRHYNVFNAEQCEGVEAPDLLPIAEPTEPFEPIAEAEKIVRGYHQPPVIEHAGKSAYYRPAEDTVRIARPEQFESREAYYATLFHELAHSTGHVSRLKRDIGTKTSPFGSPDYSKEELVAEIGSAFLAAAAGISPPTIEQSAAYIDGWRRKLKDDKRLVVKAAGQSQRAADHILGVRFDEPK